MTNLTALADACATPLVESLEAVPLDARLIYEHSPIESQSIPVGRLCREAAAILRTLAAADEKMPVVDSSLLKYGELSRPMVWQSDAQSAVLAAVAERDAEIERLRKVLIEATDVLEVLRRGHGQEVTDACYPALNNCSAAIKGATDAAA